MHVATRAFISSLSCTTLKHVRFAPVMPGHSRSKNGVASLAYGAGHPRLIWSKAQDVDGRDKPGHDGDKINDFLCPWGEARPSTIVLAMRPASEAWGKRHQNGTKHLLSCY